VARLVFLAFLAACGPVDRDGDGHLSDVDCDDDDPEISPEGTELCDGVDNNCDGATDEPEALDAPVWYVDVDDDGFGDPDRFAKACEQPIGWVEDGTDCDDADEDLHDDCGAP
jgi:hypothetical protein